MVHRSRKGRIAISAVLVVAFAVAVAVLLVAVLRNEEQEPRNGSSIAPYPIPGGVRLLIPPSSATTAWGDITVLLSDGSNTVVWSDFTTESLTGNEGNVTWCCGSPALLGNLEVWLNITDLAGDGLVSDDYITVTAGNGTFHKGASYIVVLMRDSTQTEIMTRMFYGDQAGQ